jgi:hypothetical protein
MGNINMPSSERESIPEKYWIGEELDWEAPSVPVDLRVELPFWLMIDNCNQDVDIRGHKFHVEIKDNYVELYARAIVDSRFTCIYFGPPKKLIPEVEKVIKKSHAPVMRRKCKTVLLIHSDCNKDVLAASINGDNKRKRSALLFLKSFCEAHIEIINHIIQQYRISTYDYFPYEVSPWDVPIWFVGSGTDCDRIVLQDYAAFDERPIIVNMADGIRERYKLIDETSLQSAMNAEQSAGEYELLDALNFMERGDYSDAVRRIATAIEAQTESVLRQELLKIHSVAEVEKKIRASENDFPGRFRQYQNLSRRKLSAALEKDLKTIRTIRHLIVHNAYRITFNERGKAQRAVDTGRWIYNWLENKPNRMRIREEQIGKRSIGRHFSLFNAEITSSGVIVYKPML